jgi:hypothetical protein
MERCKNVFEAILKYGHDEDWLPDNEQPHFECTDAPPVRPRRSRSFAAELNSACRCGTTTTASTTTA